MRREKAVICEVGGSAVRDRAARHMTSARDNAAWRTTATFSADDDKALLLLVVLFEKGGVIDWNAISRHLLPASWSVQELQARLEYLRYSDTACLTSLPTEYVAGSCLERTSQFDVYKAIDVIFGHITKDDVKQPLGKPHLNVGEIAPVGVTAILEKIALTSDDKFTDIGSGTGNILAQVLLQSPVKTAIGLEIRSDLAQKSRQALQAAQVKYPRLCSVEVLTGDVKVLPPETITRLHEATVLFSNNFVFQQDDMVGLHDFICSYDSLGDLRVVLLTKRLCPRCPSFCNDAFCKAWKEERVIMTQCCWKREPIEVYMYTHKSMIDNSLLRILEGL